MVRHKGLNKFCHIIDSDKDFAEEKAAEKMLAWDEMWERKLAAEKNKTAREAAREAAIRNKEEKKKLAAAKTVEAEDAIKQLETILAQTLEVDDAIDWDSLLDRNKFPDENPLCPNLGVIPKEPRRDDPKYQFKPNLFDKLFCLRKRKEQEAERAFSEDKEDWLKNKRHIQANNVALEKNMRKK